MKDAKYLFKYGTLNLINKSTTTDDYEILRKRIQKSLQILKNLRNSQLSIDNLTYWCWITT